ncbi:MAG: hypothetical protein PHH08_00500 [Candidatus ainarchaeum sp.]|nr:hypothetical protein [Candidatus ainarchaeum sp.]
MVEKERQRSYSWYLDKEKKNQVFIRFVFTSDGKGPEEFSVSYCQIIDEKPREIVRYDCSALENVHMHQFFRNHHEKKKLDKEISYETMQEFVDNIEKNWGQYLAKFKEK